MKRSAFNVVIGFCLAWGGPAPALAQSASEISFQGSLAQAGVPAEGTFDFTVSLWDAPSGGSQIGQTLQFDDDAVHEGLLDLMLDFGAGAWEGDRWLQIVVDGVTLTPRQFVSAAPRSVATRGIFVSPSGGFVGIGRQTHVTGAEIFGISKDTNGFAGMYVNTGPSGLPFYGYALDGAARTYHYLDGPSGSWRLVHAGGTALTIDPNRRVGIGTTAPSAGLEVVVSSGAAIEASSSSVHAIRGETTADNRSGVIGQHTGSGEGQGVSGTAFGTSGSGVRDHANRQGVVNYGVEGSSNSTIGYDFYASGPGINYGAPSSIRWKRNITAVADPLGKLAKIRGVYYDWDSAHGGGHDIGFVGEEVGRVVPEIVAYEPGGEFVTGMDYGRMTPLLVEAVNALQEEKDAEIADIRAENDVLRSHLDDLERLVAALASAQQREIAR
ncbi:MAG: tail fiber domain-containing protein [Phycisphaerales bacterium]|nr:tail fiber domain-containing protein [Phycisphaerales bacterium]